MSCDMNRSVTVRVPATSANIGPGFDSLGIAFSLYNTFTFTRSERTEVVGCDVRFCGEDNLALVAFRAACSRAGVTPPCVRLSVVTEVPVSRGLGSSATLLVGGAVGARHLLDLSLSDQDLFEIVTSLEGHPDNVAAALFGGMTASMWDGDVPCAVHLPLHGSYRFCAFIPDFETTTHDARRVLPKDVPFADAVFNVTRLSMLLPALATGDRTLLRAALDDRLHQPYRSHLIHEYEDVRAAALAGGADAFFISGSGSTLMAVYTDADVPSKMQTPLATLSHHWRILPLRIDTDGAKLV